MAIQIRRGTKAEWNANNSNIIAGEPAIATDTGEVFVGTGAGTYVELASTDYVDNAVAESGGGEGLSAEAKQALLACFENVAWINEDGQTYVDALEAALYPPANIKKLTAVYTQSGTVYDTDSLDSLRSDLVVTVTYTDSSTEVITAYTLSGTLTAGTSVITASYGGKNAAFTVTVTHDANVVLHNWDFTQSLTDTVGGVTATLIDGDSALVRDGNGLNFNDYCQCVDLGAVYDRNISIDLELEDYQQITPSTSYHTRMLMYGNSDATGTGLLIYRAAAFGWTSYTGSWGSTFTGLSGRSDLDASSTKLTIKIGSDGSITLYVNNVSKGTSGGTAPEKSSSYTNLYVGNHGLKTAGATFFNAKVKKVKIYREE